jgi:hypothetical protein
MVTEINALPSLFINEIFDVTGLASLEITGMPVANTKKISFTFDNLLMPGADLPLLQVKNYLNPYITSDYYMSGRLYAATSMSRTAVEYTGIALPAVSGFALSGVLDFELMGFAWYVSGQFVHIGSGADYFSTIQGRVNDLQYTFSNLRISNLSGGLMTSGYIGMRSW